MRHQVFTNKAETRGVEFVERAKAAVGIPPCLGARGKASDLFRVDRGAGLAQGAILRVKGSVLWSERAEGSMWWRARASNSSVKFSPAPRGATGDEKGMARIVQKFGGTSVAGVEHIRNVARRVKSELDGGNQVAVVVS